MRTKLLIGLILLFTLGLNTGCKVLKKVERSSLDSIAKEQKDYTLIDTGRTVITETIDTTVNVPGIEFSKVFHLKPMPDGVKFPGFVPSLLQLSDALIDLRLHYDTLTNSIQVIGKSKPQQIPVKQTKVTVEKKGLTVKDKGKTAVEVNKDDLDKEIERPDKSWIIAMVVLIVLIAVVLYLNYLFAQYYRARI